MSDRSVLTDDEKVSFRHLRHYLSAYDTYLIAPTGMHIALPGCRVRPFDDQFFGSVAANRRLMLSRSFYEAFADYEFILIYHLDALVFSDGLDAWCDLEYDYIGAPWLKSVFEPVSREAGFASVGNGGLSLRRVSSMLGVLKSRRYAVDPWANWAKRITGQPLSKRVLGVPRALAKWVGPLNNIRGEIAGVEYNEDLFWSHRATWYDPSFKIAPIEVALRFAFEEEPRYCFEQNRRRLPFGCHAWQKYDREFWEPHTLTETSTVG